MVIRKSIFSEGVQGRPRGEGDPKNIVIQGVFVTMYLQNEMEGTVDPYFCFLRSKNHVFLLLFHKR